MTESTDSPGPTGYGYVVTAIGVDPDRWTGLPRTFRDIEEAGADVIWLTDHLFSGYPGGEPFVLAAAAAAATERCAIGTGVLQLPLRNSAAVAKAASTMQLISGGRFRLGLGVGQHPREFARAGIDFPTRGATMDRMLGELVDHWVEADDWFSIRPAVRVPLWIGGRSTAALCRAARFGSGWLALFLSPERFAAAHRRLGEELVALGRDPSSVERRMILFVTPTDAGWTRRDALAFTGRQFPGGSAGVDRHVITGSVAECVENIRVFQDAGAAGIDLSVPHPEPVPRFASLRAALEGH